MNSNDLTPRELFRKKVRDICDTLDFYDDLKNELLRNNIDTKYAIKLDSEIRKLEQELADISKNMVEIDTCDCDGINEGCSSPLCRCQYINTSMPIHTKIFNDTCDNQ